METEGTIKRPMTIELTPNGKTIVVVYPSNIQGKLVARSLAILGEPEIICPGEIDPDNIMMLFPHQDMPDELFEVAEHFTTEHLLDSLGFDRQGGK